MKKYILAIDQGTTSSRALIFDQMGQIVQSAQEEIDCFYPQSGWVEQDALEIFSSVSSVVNEVLIKANITIDEIDSIGITNQRETTIVWDKLSGMPVYPAIVWQSRQSALICERWDKYKQLIHQKTGLILNPYFSASKVRFILDTIDGQARAERGELMFGTVDSWLVYKLSKGKHHVSDITNASRTMMFNIFDHCWDEQLLDIFNIPKVMLPTVVCCNKVFAEASYFNSDVKIMGLMGDQQAALFGHTCFNEGDIKNTYGTGCFMLLNTGSKPVLSQTGLLTTIAWSLSQEITYALEGSVFVAGAAIQWLRDQLKFIHSSGDSERSALMVNDSDGVYVVPSFVGLGTPYWDNEARGAIFGLTRNSSRYHITRATIEAIAYQSKDVIIAMLEETKLDIPFLSVDGGATDNHYLVQFQADILDLPIHVPQCKQLTALGVAYMAGLSSGYFKSLKEIKKIHKNEAIYLSKMDETQRNRRYAGWQQAIKATRLFKVK